ncbi:MAG TPA: hypothetical protein GXZ74_05160 [Tissierellia bacterium]|nr:hypothetical protein [Tissierellia bacterium]
MSKIRIEKRSNFTVIGNEVIFDKRLGNGAKGIFLVMMALPPTWDYTIKGLLKFTKDGYTALSSDLKELENAGYLVRSRARNEKGHLGKTEYILYETPQNYQNSQTIENTESNPEVENPILDNPILDNPIQENRNQLNTKGIKDLNNQSLKELKNKSSKEIEKQDLINLKSRLRGSVSALKIPDEVKDLMSSAFDGLINRTQTFKDACVKTQPSEVRQILLGLSDLELDGLIIQIANGYLLSLETGTTIRSFEKLMMRIIHNALVQHRQSLGYAL